MIVLLGIGAGFVATVSAAIWLAAQLVVDYLDHRQPRKQVHR